MKLQYIPTEILLILKESKKIINEADFKFTAKRLLQDQDDVQKDFVDIPSSPSLTRKVLARI